MLILITGASGFAGGRIATALSRHYGPQAIRATGRDPNKCRQWGQQTGLECIPGDLSDPDFVKKLMEGVDVLVHCAALSSPWGSYADFFRANVTPTQLLLDAAVRNGLQKMVYISTPSVYFNYSDRFGVHEDDPMNYPFVNHYTRTKFEAEMRVRDYATNGLPAVILRPRAIIGAGDTVIAPRLLRAHQEGRLRIVGRGHNMAEFTSAANLAHAVRLAIEAPDSCQGEVFNITDQEPLALWDVVQMILGRLGMETDLKKVPYPVAYSAAWLSERWHRLLKLATEPTLTCYSVGILRYSLTMDPKKAQNLLGYRPLMTTEEGIQEFTNWYTTL